MFKFLKGAFAKESSSAPAQRAAAELTNVRPGDVSLLTNVKRELILGVFRDTLRKHGIPLEWVACDVIAIGDGPDGGTVQIQLVLTQWQESFLRYIPALERMLIRELERVGPSANYARSQIAWRFSPDCGCPFKVMPPAHIWSHAQVAAAAAEVEKPDIFDRRKTRRAPEPKLAVTDHSRNDGPDDPDDDGYQRTQLSTL